MYLEDTFYKVVDPDGNMLFSGLFANCLKFRKNSKRTDLKIRFHRQWAFGEWR